MLFDVEWEEMALFLKIDKRQSQKKGAVQANLSRFKQISKWFTGKKWNRSNFRAFLAYTEERGLGQESLNKYVAFGKYNDNLSIQLNSSCQLTFFHLFIF